LRAQQANPKYRDILTLFLNGLASSSHMPFLVVDIHETIQPKTEAWWSQVLP
jgi:hypothetical protein